MIFIFLCGFICVIAVGDVGADRYGFDLPGMPIAVQSAAQCKQLCDQTQDCVVWSISVGGSCGIANNCWLKNMIPPLTANPCRISGVKGRSLVPLQFTPLPVGQIMPLGWLKSQLQIQAEGLAGHLSEFWADIKDSIWIGGTQTDPGHLDERVPYWLNGMVPLAFLTNDPNILSQVHKYLDYILDHQTPEGWLGPDGADGDPWPRFPLLLALIQYAEANNGDKRTIDAMHSFLLNLRNRLFQKPLASWASYRWQDLAYAIQWLYDNYPQGQEDFLLDFAELVHAQGFDWEEFYVGNDFPTVPCTGNCPSLATHGVNNGQALKSAAVWFRSSGGDPDLPANSKYRLQRLDKYHGIPSGMFSCSEHLAGINPSQGTETCTVVEAIFSYRVMFSTFGDVGYMDRLEKITYNALPASLDPFMWAHVYLQQSNQINSQHNDPNIFVTDGPDSNIYGLAPNFGCCTATFGTGWPKFATSLFMRTKAGIAAVAYAPSSVKTFINGVNVSIILTTDYPFDDTLVFLVNSNGPLPFSLRIPAWAKNPTIKTDNASPIPVTPGTFATTMIKTGTSTITLKLPMSFQSTKGPVNDYSTISRGPLVYSLQIGESWKQLAHYYMNSSDWQINNSTAWNFALLVDENNPDNSFQFMKNKISNPPFNFWNPPVYAVAKGRQVPWEIYKNAADKPPQSPVSSSAPLQSVTLVPFGAVQLRIAAFPTLQN